MRLPALTLALLCLASPVRAEPVNLVAGTYLFEFTDLQPGVSAPPCGFGLNLSWCMHYSLQSGGGTFQVAVFDELDSPPLFEEFPAPFISGIAAHGGSVSLTLSDLTGYVRVTLTDDVVFDFLAVSLVLTFNNPPEPGTQINHLLQVVTLGSPPAPIPEPATGVLLLIGLGAVCRRRVLGCNASPPSMRLRSIGMNSAAVSRPRPEA